MDEQDCVVIGAGVVGLACARALARAGRQVLILEQESTFGTATSARNSEVVHAGLYYPPGSLRATLCVRGRALLYAFCEQHGVAHRRCGKLVVASTPDDLPYLAALQAQARANGATEVTLLSGNQARALEPALACVGALHSPATGVVDSHGLMLALLADAEAHGAQWVTRAAVRSGQLTPQGWTLAVASPTEPAQAAFPLRARSVVNAAGLQACELAAQLQGLPAAWVPRPWFAQGA